MFHANPQEDDAKFFEFSKKAEDGPSQAGRLSKPFPEVPIGIPCIERQSRVAALHTSGTRNTQGLIGNVGCSRAARCLRIVKLSCVGQGIHLVLRLLNLSQELTHIRRIPLLLHR